MHRKAMCTCICVMIALGAALYIAGQALEQELKVGKKWTIRQQEELARGSMWCINLSKLFGVVAFLLILCCQCCRGVDFEGAGGGMSHHAVSDYE
jgi:hypothetical protein